MGSFIRNLQCRFHERVGKPVTATSNGFQNWFDHANLPNSLSFEQNAHHPADLESQLTCSLAASLIIDQEEAVARECQCDRLLFAWSQPLCQVIDLSRER